MSFYTLTGDQFWDLFETFSDPSQRLIFMQWMELSGFDYTKSEVAPDELLNHFYFYDYEIDYAYFYANYENTDAIADVFINCFGKTMLCVDACFQAGLPPSITIIDSIEIVIYHIKHAGYCPLWAISLRDSFIRKGCKAARYFLPGELYYEYLQTYRDYNEYDCDVFEGLSIYDYPSIKEKKEIIHMELIKELYHPRRINKFLETNENIEDYLN